MSQKEHQSTYILTNIDQKYMITTQENFKMLFHANNHNENGTLPKLLQSENKSITLYYVSSNEKLNISELKKRVSENENTSADILTVTIIKMKIKQKEIAPLLYTHQIIPNGKISKYLIFPEQQLKNVGIGKVNLVYCFSEINENHGILYKRGIITNGMLSEEQYKQVKTLDVILEKPPLIQDSKLEKSKTTLETIVQKPELEKSKPTLDVILEKPPLIQDSKLEKLKQRSFYKIGSTTIKYVGKIGSTTLKPINKIGSTTIKYVEKVGSTTLKPINKIGSTTIKYVEKVGSITLKPINKIGSPILKYVEKVGSIVYKPMEKFLVKPTEKALITLDVLADNSFKNGERNTTNHTSSKKHAIRFLTSIGATLTSYFALDSLLIPNQPLWVSQFFTATTIGVIAFYGYKFTEKVLENVFLKQPEFKKELENYYENNSLNIKTYLELRSIIEILEEQKNEHVSFITKKIRGISNRFINHSHSKTPLSNNGMLQELAEGAIEILIPEKQNESIQNPEQESLTTIASN